MNMNFISKLVACWNSSEALSISFQIVRCCFVFVCTRRNYSLRDSTKIYLTFN